MQHKVNFHCSSLNNIILFFRHQRYSRIMDALISSHINLEDVNTRGWTLPPHRLATSSANINTAGECLISLHSIPGYAGVYLIQSSCEEYMTTFISFSSRCHCDSGANGRFWNDMLQTKKADN